MHSHTTPSFPQPWPAPAQRVDAGTIALQRSQAFQARQDRQHLDRLHAAEDAASGALTIYLATSLIGGLARGIIRAFQH